MFFDNSERREFNRQKKVGGIHKRNELDKFLGEESEDVENEFDILM